METRNYLSECWVEFWKPDSKPLQIINYVVSIVLLLVSAVLFVWQNDIPRSWRDVMNNLVWILPLIVLVLYLLLVIPYRVAINHKRNWRKVVIERDDLIKRAKPKLKIVDTST